MTDIATHIDQLFAAELQFRLASAVRLAVTADTQPLDLPMEWTHGKHKIRYEEMALRKDQADFAAALMHHSAVYMMTVAMKDAISAAVPHPDRLADPNVQAAFQISRLIRNAFAHGPFNPVWKISEKLRDRIIKVRDIISLDTTNLNDEVFDWRHYGGPIAMLRLCQYVRLEILRDSRRPRRVIPFPKNIYYQQGDQILKRITKPSKKK